MTKILLLDLDGTIRRPKTGIFIDMPKSQEPIEGAKKGIEYFSIMGWKIAGISNQGGIAAGHKTLEQTIEEMKFTLELFPQLDSIFFCPDFEGKKCVIVEHERISKYCVEDLDGWKKTGNPKIETINFRKPGTAMLHGAIEKLAKLEVSDFIFSVNFCADYDCWFVGDRPEDEQAAANFGCNFMWADIWRKRFLPGVQEFHNITPQEIEFLQGISLK